jgi:uncharacterized alkaline shock family protein YloU
MNIFSRTLLAIYALSLAVISIGAIIVTLSPSYLPEITDYLVNSVLSDRNISIFLIIVELIFFIASLIYLLSGIKSDKNNKSILKLTKLGAIRISLGTIENISLATAKKFSGIKEAKASVVKLGDGVAIHIKATVLADINLPSLMEDVQNKVNSAVEEICGIKVNEVNTSVESIHYGYKSRVE